MVQNIFRVIVTVYNAEKWIYKCLQSIKLQTYQIFYIYIVNDGSTDNTGKEIQRFIDESVGFGITYINEKTNSGSGLLSMIKCWKCFRHESEDNIMMTVDGDDWLADNTVLEKLNQIYQDRNVWLTYGNMEASNKTFSGILNETDPTTIRKNFVSWDLSHLRSFRLGLFNKVKKADMKSTDGKYYSYANDISFMVPMGEMATKEHCRYIKDILYIYNNENPLSDMYTNPVLQHQKAIEILAKEPYKSILDFRVMKCGN
jgi:glycosyltransferase involved in cell wall biosynthesis